MKFLAFFTKYNTRIAVIIVLSAIVSIFVSGYSRDYEKTARSVNTISKAEEVSVKIETYPAVSDNTVQFDGTILSSGHKNLNGLKMNVYLTSYTKGALYPGDILILSGKIFHSEKRRNIGGFDDIEYGKSLGTYGTIYCDKTSEIRLFKESSNTFMKTMCTLRERFMQRADEVLDQRYSSIAKALVTGDKSTVYPSDKENLQKSGVYHIVAISGLHLNIFIMIFSYFISRLRLKRYKKAILSFFICSLAGGFVLIFTGFGTSVIRAFTMLLISLFSAVFCRQYRPKSSLFMATVIILIFIPSAFYSVGFRLSVLSTLGVLISADIIKYFKTTRKLSGLASYGAVGTAVTSFVCAAVTLPVTADVFGYMAVYSFLANILILPLMAPALGMCVVFGVVSLSGLDIIARLIAYPLTCILRLILFFADFVSSLPLSTINLYPRYTLYAIILAFSLALGIYYICKERRIAALSVLISFTVAVSINFVYNIRNDEARVIFPYSGQGDCAIISLPGDKAFMIDFGTSSYTNYVEDEIMLSLIKYNIRKLDGVFVSHFHTDHMSGIVNLVNKGYADNIFVPMHYDTDDDESTDNMKKLMAASLKSHTPITCLEKGNSIKLDDDIRFDIISPSSEMDLDANSMSMVIKFTYGDTPFLFTGDISDETTKLLYESDIECSVIKIAHHGSKSSGDKKFIKKANPSYALISCGENNSYGHPHKKVTQTLGSLKIKTYRTDKNGTVTFYLNKEGIKSIKTMR